MLENRKIPFESWENLRSSLYINVKLCGSDDAEFAAIYLTKDNAKLLPFDDVRRQLDGEKDWDVGFERARDWDEAYICDLALNGMVAGLSEIPGTLCMSPLCQLEHGLESIDEYDVEDIFRISSKRSA
jgi:hypothetical protein